MEYKKYKVSDECIGCMACVEVASDNFDMNNNNIAYLKKQPSALSEQSLCNEALDVCPVGAISSENIQQNSSVKPILASSNIKQTLDAHPELKPILIELSPMFKRMQKPALYNTLAKYANFKDAAKVTGVSVCEILHAMNSTLGTEDALHKSMPECLNTSHVVKLNGGQEIDWEESNERYIYNSESMSNLIEKVSNLDSQENLVIISIEEPIELLRVVEGLEFKYNIEKTKEYRISIFNPKVEENIPWQDRKDEFEVMDVRNMTSDPFDILIKKAYEIEEDFGFILIQTFEPTPMINMLAEMGFEYLVEQKSFGEVWVYFHKLVTDGEDSDNDSEKPEVVIQSATPVAYPVIMRLLQSDKIQKAVKVKELKVWEETEKHLAWIANGKADISFSALITSAKLKKHDVKIPALFVWDNFVILSRDSQAKKLSDLEGYDIHTPLFEEAPPAKITKYLIQASGLNPDNFNFVFGEPFGRPEKIYSDFVTGHADHVILREPEASYAVKIMKDRGIDIAEISYNKLWNQINEGFGSFPNAGIVLKGEFTRKYPEITQVLLDELKDAIQWVNDNKQASANLSFDMMRQPTDRVELFLDRVNFEYVEGDKLVKKVKDYFDILSAQGIVEAKIDDEFLSAFKLDK